MFQKLFKYTLIGLFFSFYCYGQNYLSINKIDPTSIVCGAEQPEIYLELLKSKRIGVVTNQTGIVIDEISVSSNYHDITEQAKVSVIDFMIGNGLDVVKIFSPEHGFRGTEDAGATVKSGKDSKTGLPIISLYGKNKKPTAEQIKDLDVIVFDLQDVGVRFYTYISTLHFAMEAVAEQGLEIMVFDRPNPNGHYVDGPVLNMKYSSFVGMHPVPIVYGMTIGEYAQMINGEGWLAKGLKANLTVIPLKNYEHNSSYSLPVKPSPNLPNDKSVNLYPSTCFFEAFNGSEGRGTNFPFQVYGSPYLKKMDFQFIPEPNSGAANPRFNGEVCYGEDLRDTPYLSEINLDWLIKARDNYTGKEPFWIKNSGEFWIDKLAGTDELRKQIDGGWTQEQIKATWQKDLEEFKEIRQKYLIYN